MSSCRRAAAVLALAGGLAVLPACGGDPAAPREGVTAEELTGDVSGDFDIATADVGRRVSLRATVTRVLSAGAFEVAAADAASDRPLLVLNREDALQVGQDVQIEGRVRLYDTAEHAGAYGVGPGQAQERAPVVVADEVDTDLPEDDQ
jgi:hypothetical protein